MILVFCPAELCGHVKSVLNKRNIKAQINSTEKDNGTNVICHINSERLAKKEQEFLIKSIKEGRRVLDLLTYLDYKLGYTEIDLLTYKYFLQNKTFSILSKKRTQIIKRVMDICISFILLVILSPVLLLTILAIKLESKGGAFFFQKRVGQFNKEFTIIKLRSMVNDAELNGAQWAKVNDSRVTRVGSFIRKTRIDEIPQLFNVIKGEMSLIGPRPERDVFIKKLEKEIPFYRFRHAVKPGVTGLAQVKYPYGASVEDAKWKHRYDLYYIKHHDLAHDFKVLALTVKTVLFGMGR